MPSWAPTDIPFLELAQIFESISIGVIAILGAFGLKRYLVADDIKERYRIIRESNQKLKKLSTEILRSIDLLDNKDRPLSVRDLRYFRKLAAQLEKQSDEASSVPQTICYLLRTVLNELETGYKTDNAMSITSYLDLVSFFYDTLGRMIYYIDHTIELPKKEKEPLSGLIGRFITDRSKDHKLEPGSFGIYLSHKSEAGRIVYETAVKNGCDPIFLSLICKVIHSNYHAVKRALDYDIYIPPSFTYRPPNDNLFPLFVSPARIHLVHTRMDRKFSASGESSVITAYYSDFGLSHIDFESSTAARRALIDMVDEISSKRFTVFFPEKKILAQRIMEVELPIHQPSNEDWRYKNILKSRLKVRFK